MKNKVISGINIYHDKNGRAILYNRKTKTGYVIHENKERQYRLYSNRYVILVIIFALLANFIKNILVVAGITLVLGLMLEYSYRKRFLPSLTIITNMKPFEKVTLLDGLIKNNDKKRCLILGILYLTLAILIIVNGINTNADNLLMIGNIIISIGALYYAIINLIAFSKINKWK